ncbi:ribonuclease-domain-containing protein [Daldinia caldariorum]|uniref:ribonuclease-domain-containing protein n=1 Tax=Daldinia caldariorum TaxID=326644 RepID=UPI0020082079|nr:ribonuclease-domain-containing protein [Daldinia caldariorum]KAI1470110.1 ribonuclease-domain-containing protein [Daldinia caldariorum]
MQFTSGLVFLPLAALLASVAAAPVVEDRAAQAATTCGSTYYSATQVNQAAQKACSYYSSGSAPGGYPHTYNNYEGFSFSVSGPYLEFPLLSSGSVYTGGSPGPDRVVINTSCKLAGEITHTGASGNNFVGCSGTS